MGLFVLFFGSFTKMFYVAQEIFIIARFSHQKRKKKNHCQFWGTLGLGWFSEHQAQWEPSMDLKLNLLWSKPRFCKTHARVRQLTRRTFASCFLFLFSYSGRRFSSPNRAEISKFWIGWLREPTKRKGSWVCSVAIAMSSPAE